MSNSYWKLFSIPGTLGFSSAALLGRMPAGMIGFAIILPISQLTGSYANAGIVAAATMVGMALCAPYSGRLVDNYGQQLILLIFAALNFIGTSALIVCIQFDLPLGVQCIAAILAGGSRVSTGTMARTRWTYVIQILDPEQRKETLRTAYAFESVIDEIVFILAPIFATLLCTIVQPLAGLIFCLLSYVIGTVLLAMQRGTQPTVIPVHGKQPLALVIPGLQAIFAAILCIGISAGAVEVIVVARADDLGLRSLAGFLMATLAFGSILSGFWYGARKFKLSPYSLWIRCLCLLALGLIPLAAAGNPFMLALALFIAGLLIAPTTIAGQLLTELILPAKILNEGMSMIVTAMILGMAIGSWLSGILIDKFDAYLTSSLPAVAVLVALTIAGMCAQWFRRGVVD